jgi:hypothetical protein
MTYGEIGLTTNEFLAPRWEKVFNFSSFQYVGSLRPPIIC